MPRGFATLDREARLMLVAGRFAAWIAEFHLSWKHAEREGVVRPLFLSYEQDFLGGRHMLARKLSEFLGPKASAIRLSALLDNRDVPAAGQGKDMPRAVRDFVLRMIDGYGQGEDLTLLLGE